MATLVLGLAGQAIGGAIAPGLSVLGGAITGATIGGAVGGLIGNVVDAKLLGQSFTRQVEGPRLTDIQIQASTEGAPIPRIYGRARLAGQLIWATDFEERATTTSETVGGGKGFGGGSSTTVETTTYSYYASFAVGLCEGPADRLGRVWADGKPLDLSGYTVRFYKGGESQLPDSLIEAVEGSGNAPAYRGLCYVVFESLPLARFGNRIPQLSFELFRTLDLAGVPSLEKLIAGASLIPGSGEFVYATQKALEDLGQGTSKSITINNNMGDTDFNVSMDALADQLPNCKTVALVVGWFGDDLRCNLTKIRPGVENRQKKVIPRDWTVSNQTRSTAYVVSTVDGRPAYGGTPSDHVVFQAIQALKARGYKVLFYPFIFMDIPAGNSLPDPYNPGSYQPVYPWRGRISVDPAPGVAGSPDKTSAAASQIGAFFGNADATQFSVSGDAVTYTGPTDWGLRRMILHYAHLCQAAGGVDAFLIGSELRGITTVRMDDYIYPGVVNELYGLVNEVESVLPGAKLSYGADWSEFFGHQPQDGSGDVFFHLDDIWSHSDVDFVAIDNYWPLADWRGGTGHLDAVTGAGSIYDIDYLQSNIEGGEGYDWYYASAADRDSQTRTPITDAAYGKPWVFRFKDLANWWSNAHYERPGGVEEALPTLWEPQSKPVWFTEVGCPAVDKGANQPNVFVDPKSSESLLPYYSDGTPDDLVQRRYLEAVYSYWDPSAGNNRLSSVYGDWMVTTDNIYSWTWDARPFPDFPARTTTWSDGPNWTLGHWLTGRVGQIPLADLVADLCLQVGFTAYDVSQLSGLVTGFLLERIMSPRDAIEALMLTYQFDAVESEGVIKFQPKTRAPFKTLTPDDLVLPDGGDGRLLQLTRAQETELPAAIKIKYIDSDKQYAVATAESRRLVGQSARVAQADMSLMIDPRRAQAAADTWLMQSWVERERASWSLPPSSLALDPNDIVELTVGSELYRYRITEITDRLERDLNLVANDPTIYDVRLGARDISALQAPVIPGPPLVHFMDMPLLRDADDPHAPYIAAYASPWPGAVDIYRSVDTGEYVLNRKLIVAATVGVTQWDFYAGPVGRWDRGNVVRIAISGGTLDSKSELAVLNGANALAIQNPDGEWEILQFQQATLVAPDIYDISLLLRGQKGTEQAMGNPVPAGAPVVVLNGALSQLSLSVDDLAAPYDWTYGPAGQPLTDVSYVTEQHAFAMVGLRPLSPAHITGLRQANNDIVISWVRRTRIGGDSWEQTEVPLGESAEAYEVDILNGATIVRTLSASSPSVTYTAAQQTADFGVYPSPLTVRVYQLSGTVGRGSKQEEILWHV